MRTATARLETLGYAAPAANAAWEKVARYARNVALFTVAPFVGLAYVLAFPFVGLGALVWIAVRAGCERNAA
jgi:hypothetical protein